MLQEQTTLPVGAIVRSPYSDGYIVERLLSRSGFGAVYQVRERHNRQNIFALKEVINPSPQGRKRLFLECELLKRLHHPALPRVYHVFEQNELKRIYLLMEYISGKDLEALLAEQPEGRFSLRLALTVLSPIVDALMYLHQQEPPILHRDVKPANIIVPQDGSIAALVDFGTAKEYTPEVTTILFRRGSPGYAAIEQYSPGSDIDERTDVYGLGATLYTLLTGVKPMDAIKRAVMRKGNDGLQPVHVLVPEIPLSVSHAIQRAMALYYEDRYASVEDFWQALHSPTEELVAVTPVPQIEEVARSKTIPPKRRKWLAPVLVLLLLLILGASGLFFAFSHFARPVSPPSTSKKAPTVIATTATTASSPTATISTAPYPSLASSYTGVMSDISVTNKQTPLSLDQVHQMKNTITGTFHGLGLVSSFTGTITTSGVLHFVVKSGPDSLIFDGEIRQNGDLDGAFYEVGQQGNRTGAYGPWYAIHPSR